MDRKAGQPCNKHDKRVNKITSEEMKFIRRIVDKIRTASEIKGFVSI